MKSKAGSLKRPKTKRQSSSQANERDRERERTQVTNIRNERGDITINPMDIKRKIEEYYEQLYPQILCWFLTSRSDLQERDMQILAYMCWGSRRSYAKCPEMVTLERTAV